MWATGDGDRYMHRRFEDESDDAEIWRRGEQDQSLAAACVLFIVLVGTFLLITGRPCSETCLVSGWDARYVQPDAAYYLRRR